MKVLLSPLSDNARSTRKSHRGFRSGGLQNPQLRWIAAVGRMALTNYLLQPIVFGFVFYSSGFGQFGRMGVRITLVGGLALYRIQIRTCARRSSRGLLTTNLALFSRMLQLPMAQSRTLRNASRFYISMYGIGGTMAIHP
ncbi:MAG: DUF418 domain-containing protein [Acidobacteria bacterium]|nr:DUF418 domain-containing protein [Acidobacteriota bacterium]